MFACLTIEPPEPAGAVGSFLRALKKPQIASEALDWDGTGYLLIRARPSRRGPDWDRICEAAGRWADRLLLPESLQQAENCPIRPVRFEAFDREVLLQTACELANRTRMPMYRRVLGLVDEEGRYGEMLFPLLHHYTAVKVLTGAQSYYEALGEEMMERLGAPVQLCREPAGFSDCVLLLIPGEIPLPASYRPPCPVLTGPAPQQRQGWDVFFSPQVDIPPDKPQPPPGISPHRFAGALYEFAAVRVKSRLAASRILYNYRSVGLTQAAGALCAMNGIPTS